MTNPAGHRVATLAAAKGSRDSGGMQRAVGCERPSSSVRSFPQLSTLMVKPVHALVFMLIYKKPERLTIAKGLVATKRG